VSSWFENRDSFEPSNDCSTTFPGANLLRPMRPARPPRRVVGRSGPVGQGFARVGDLRPGVARDEVGGWLSVFRPRTEDLGVSVSESSGLRAPRPEVLGCGLTGGYGGWVFGEFDSRAVSGDQEEKSNARPETEGM